MKVTLIRYTECPENLCSQAAAICVGKDKGSHAAMHGAVKSGHESLLEHANFTFLIEGVSRSLLAQLTRHRHFSFSVESQRYVPYKEGFAYVVPPTISELGHEEASDYFIHMKEATQAYEHWLNTLGDDRAEDARFVLPNACTTRLLMTGNARALKQFFALRCCQRAQWEIRELANQMLNIMNEYMGGIFKKNMAFCDQNGYCREKKSCGRAPRIDDLLATYRKGHLNILRDEIYNDAEAHGLWKTVENSRVTPLRPFMRHMAAKRIADEVQEAVNAAQDPDHFAEELADVIITALSAAGLMYIDIEKAVRDKMAVNKERPFEHKGE